MEFPGFLPSFLGPSKGSGEVAGSGGGRLIPPTTAELTGVRTEAILRFASSQALLESPTSEVDLQRPTVEADYYGE